MGSFLGWFVGSVVLIQQIFVLPWLFQSAQYKIFFNAFVPIAHLAGQAALLGRLSPNTVCISGATTTQKKCLLLNFYSILPPRHRCTLAFNLNVKYRRHRECGKQYCSDISLWSCYSYILYLSPIRLFGPILYKLKKLLVISKLT